MWVDKKDSSIVYSLPYTTQHNTTQQQMTTVAAAKHFTTSLFHPSSSSSSCLSLTPRRRTIVTCTSLPPHQSSSSRRLVSFSLLFIPFFSLPPKGADGAGMMDKLDKYMKKKKLDPLEAYIPAVILTELQIKELGQYLEVDKPKFADCRNLLRSGPASSLRINIRAVAQYASDGGNGQAATREVDQCLRALEELDSLLLNASRNNSDASVESMKRNVDVVVDALNSLLKTVPSDVLDKGKAMAEAYLAPEQEVFPEKNAVDPELKQLESLL